MDNINFCKSFSFKTIAHRTLRTTDNSKGISCSFFARMLCGSGRISTVSDGELVLKKGDVFYLPRGLKYRSFWSPDESGTVVWESLGFALLPLGGEKFAPQIIDCKKSELCLFDSIKKDVVPSPESVGYLYLFAASVLPRMKRDFDSPSDKLAEKIRTFISKNLDSDVPELARHCKMSESSLYGFFREYIGKTPVEIKQEIQIEKAAEYLSTTELSVERIASLCGFHSAAYFRKIFKDHLVLSPMAYRKKHVQSNSL